MDGLYEVSTNTKPIIGGKQVKTGDDPIHWHESIELLYFIKGSCKVLNGNEEIRVTKGDLIVINSEALHSVRCDEKTPVPGEYIYFIVNHTFCEEMGFFTGENFITKKLRDKRIDRYFEIIEKELEEQKNYYNESVKINILNILLILFREYIIEGYNEQKNSAKITLTKKMVKYIRKNMQRPITTADIENYCGYSKYYLSRVFREITGKTIMRYLNEIRTNEAKIMLSSSDMSISTIASECGFESQSYFGKVFKKYTGFSPIEFRNTH